PIPPDLIHYFVFFLFNHPPTPHTYTLSLHDALPISPGTTTSRGCCATRASVARASTSSWTRASAPSRASRGSPRPCSSGTRPTTDRKSTRLNSSHVAISYAVFCLKKKKKKT